MNDRELTTLRGSAAIVGIGETPHRRSWPGRSMIGLCAQAATQAIADAGLKLQDIDGLITMSGVSPARMAEYVGLRPTGFAVSAGLMGATSGVALTIAAAVLDAGICNYVLFVAGGARDPQAIPVSPGIEPGFESEWFTPYGPAAGANTYYGLLYSRHIHQYGTRPEQLAHIAVNQRFNAAKNELAALRDPITVADVMGSRLINYPLRMLDCVMPVAGAIAYIVTRADRAGTLRKPAAYLLGAGVCQGHDNYWYTDDMTITPTSVSAPSAYRMAGYGPRDMQFLEFYDCYTILIACCLEDAGFCAKGEIGEFIQSTDTTCQGALPINTDGGQLSAGQLNGYGASGCQHIVEAVRQIRGEAGERQVRGRDLCLINLNGGTPSQEVTLVLGSENAL